MIAFFIDMWTDGWIGKLMALLMVSVAGFVAWRVFVGVYYAADSWFVVHQTGTATVVDRKHTLAWTQTIIHNNGKLSWVQIIHHPESWGLVMELEDGRRDSFGVGQDAWRTVENGRKVAVTFKEGRISGGAYVVTADL